MSILRLPYYELSAEAVQGLQAANKALEKSPLGRPLICLLYTSPSPRD